MDSQRVLRQVERASFLEEGIQQEADNITKETKKQHTDSLSSNGEHQQHQVPSSSIEAVALSSRSKDNPKPQDKESLTKEHESHVSEGKKEEGHQISKSSPPSTSDRDSSISNRDTQQNHDLVEDVERLLLLSRGGNGNKFDPLNNWLSRKILDQIPILPDSIRENLQKMIDRQEMIVNNGNILTRRDVIASNIQESNQAGNDGSGNTVATQAKAAAANGTAVAAKEAATGVIEGQEPGFDEAGARQALCMILFLIFYAIYLNAAIRLFLTCFIFAMILHLGLGCWQSKPGKGREAPNGGDALFFGCYMMAIYGDIGCCLCMWTGPFLFFIPNLCASCTWAPAPSMVGPPQQVGGDEQWE